MQTLIITACVLAVIALGWTILSWSFVRGIEKPKYKVLQKINGLEIREYKSYIAAEVEVKGDYRDAVTRGFTILAGYIFGGNKGGKEIKMTAPVQETPIKKTAAGLAGLAGEKIAMTSPVIEKSPAKEIHTISFMMPSKYTLKTLPEPDSKQITFHTIPPHKIAAIAFNWWAGPKRAERKKALLLKKLAELKKTHTAKTTHLPLSPKGPVSIAGYNPPFSAPWMHHTEVWVEVE